MLTVPILKHSSFLNYSKKIKSLKVGSLTFLGSKVISTLYFIQMFFHFIGRLIKEEHKLARCTNTGL